MISAGNTRVRAGMDPAKVARSWFKELRAETKAESAPRGSKKVDEARARSTVSHTAGFAGASRFGTKAPDLSFEGRIASRVGDGVPSAEECHFLALAAEKLPLDKFVGVMERLIERGAQIVSHHRFRGLLDRDGNLAVNQAIRQANDNIAYRTVDFDLDDMNDDEIWAAIDGSRHSDLIKRNAVGNMLKMAKKLGILEELENS